MVPVGYCLVATVLAVNMFLIVYGAMVVWGAFLRVSRVHFDAMFVHVIAMRVV
jgi:hypothetical protein